MAPRPDPLRAFVNRSYSEPLRARAFKRLKRKGFTLPEGLERPVRLGPGQQVSTRYLEDGATRAQVTTPGQRRLVPRDFAGDPSVSGPSLRQPRVSPERFEFGQNEFGRWFTRPRNELTGLDPQAKADVMGFDRQTDAQGQRIAAAYAQLADQSAADSGARTQALQELQGMSGAGYNPADQTAQQLRSAAQAGSGATRALWQVQTSSLPTLARAQGRSALDAFTATRQGQRAETLQGYRTAQSEARTASAGQAYEAQSAQADRTFAEQKFRRELAATLRGQGLDFLGLTTGQNAANTRALLQSRTTLASGAVDAQTSLANNALDSQTSLANNALDSQTSLANNQLDAQGTAAAAGVRDAAARRREAASRAKDARRSTIWNPSTRKDLAKDLAAKWRGEDADADSLGRPVAGTGQEGWRTWGADDVVDASNRQLYIDRQTGASHLNPNMDPRAFQVARWVASNQTAFTRKGKLRDRDVRQFLEANAPGVSWSYVSRFLDQLL